MFPSKMHLKRYGVAWIFAVIAGLFAACPTMWSQGTGSISGRALDASGAVIPDANVAVKDVETGVTHSTTTDSSGNYRVLALPVGQYEVRVEKTGFAPAVHRIDLVIGQEAVVDATLVVGSTTQSVVISEEAPVVNTTTAETGGLVSEAQVKDLPLNGRSFDNLVLLDAGTNNMKQMQATGAVAGGFGNLFVVSGRRTDTNIYYLNGVQYAGVAEQADSPGSVSGQLLGVDAIREFNLLTDNYSAQYGKRSGGQVLIATMSGTNSLHGSAFEFLRNSSLDARQFFDQSPSVLGKRLPHFVRNNFGGSLGGPIRKDKTFIFGNYEGFRQILGLTNVAVVPDLIANPRTSMNSMLPCVSTTLATTPDCNQSTGKLMSTGAFVPITMGVGAMGASIQPFLNVYPAPNGPELLTPVITVGGVTTGGAPTGLATYNNSPRSTIREDFGTTRFDQTFSAKDSLNAAYTIDDGESLTPQLLDAWTTGLLYRAHVASLSEVHIFSPNFLNTATLGFSRAYFNQYGVQNEAIPAGNSLLPGYPMGGLTVTQGGGFISGGLTGTGATSNSHSTRNLLTERDDVQIIRGKHLFAFGIWFNQLFENNALLSGPTGGGGSFATLQALLQGNMQATQLTFAQNPADFRVNEGAWYVEDTIKLRSNLTVTAGVRHEWTNGWNEAHGNMGNFPFMGNFPIGIMPSMPTVESQLFHPNLAKWLFEPRLGLAWAPGSDGKTAIRAGFGIYRNFLDNLDFNSTRGLPFTVGVAIPAQQFPYPVVTDPHAYPNALPSAQAFDGANQRTPTVLAYNLKIERQLTSSLALDIGYSGSHGYHLTVQPDGNSPYPLVCGGGTQIYPASDFPGGVYPACPTTGGIAGQTLTFSNGLPPGTLYYGWACVQATAGCVNMAPAGSPFYGVATGTVVNKLPVAGRNPALGSEYGMFVSQAISHYDGLIVELTQHTRYGLTFKGNYVWSRSFDDSSEVDAFTGGSVEAGDPNNLLYDYSPSTFDIKHRFRFSGLYELPFGHGKHFGNNLSGVADKLAGGWQVNTIITVQQGLPFTPLLGFNQSKNGDIHNPDRPSWDPTFTGVLYPHTVNEWVNPAAFKLAPAGTLGNAGRDSLIQPNLRDVDFSIFKGIRLTERLNMQFRTETFNLFNRTNFGLPGTGMLTSTGGFPSSAGRISSVVTESRRIQFGLKLLW